MRATWGRTAPSWHRFQAVLLLQVTTAGTQSHGCRCVLHPELQHAAASEEQNREPESCSSAQEALLRVCARCMPVILLDAQILASTLQIPFINRTYVARG